MAGNLYRLLHIATVVPLLPAAVALLMLFLAGPGYQLQWWDLGIGFALLRWSGWLGAAATVLVAPVFLMLLWRGPRSRALLAGLVLVAGVTAAAIPYTWQQRAESVPPIHDITTDTENPPAFIAIARLRREAANPVEYPGEETARAQREAYPDIRSLQFDTPPEVVFSAAREAVNELGWDLVEADADDGRIEATDTTRWFGFTDDIVIRIRAENGLTQLDIRSKSRIGRSDVGTNARRIRIFREVMQAKLSSPGRSS